MNNEFENMHHHQSEVDPLEIWAAIEPQVDALNEKRRKKRGFFFWWSFGASVVFIGVALIWMFNNTLELGSFPILEEGTQIKNSGSNTNLTGTIDSIANKEEVYTDQSLNINEAKESRLTENDLLGISSKRNTHHEEELMTKTPFLDQNSNRKGSVVDILTNNESPTVSIEPSSREITSLNSPVSDLSNSPLNNEVKFLPIIKSTPEWIKTRPLTNFDKNITFSNNPYKKINLCISLQGGASFTKRNLQLLTNDSLRLLPLREQHETPLESHHYGIQLRAEHRSGFEFSLGLNKTSIIERFDYNKTLSSDTSWAEGVKFIYHDLQTDTSVMIMGLVPTVTKTIDFKKIYNSYNLLEIPLILGYSRQWDTWKIAAQAGVFMNLSLKAKGKVLANEEQFLNLETLETPIYKSKIGLAYHFGFSLRKQIGSNLELSISPFVRSYTSNFTLKGYSHTQKYTLLGGNMGITYRFRN